MLLLLNSVKYEYLLKSFLSLKKSWRVGVFHSKWAPYLIQCSQNFCKWWYNRFILCHMSSKDDLIVGSCKSMVGVPHSISPHMWKWMFLICHVTSYGKVPPFHVDSYWSCPIGDIKYLICYVTSPNHMIEGLYNFMSWNLSLCVVEM